MCVWLSWAFIDYACGRLDACVRPKVVSRWNRKGQKSTSKQRKQQQQKRTEEKKKHIILVNLILHTLCLYVIECLIHRTVPNASLQFQWVFLPFLASWVFDYYLISFPCLCQKVVYDDNGAQSRTKVDQEIVVCVFPFLGPNQIQQTSIIIIIIIERNYSTFVVVLVSLYNWRSVAAARPTKRYSV